MGWLLACFGCTKKRKRPKKASKFGPKSRRIQSYQPLESESSDVPVVGDASHPLTCSDLEPRDKPKEENKPRIRKKVRFNLEVTTYELLPAEEEETYNSLEFQNDNYYWGEQEEDNLAEKKAVLGYVALNKPKFASNHRYNNCYDDEDEYHDDNDHDIEDELSDLDDDDDDEDEEDEYNSCLIDADTIYHEEIQEDNYHIISVPLSSAENGEQGTGNSNKLATRLRGHYVVPVLNPIENLSQWKAIKARKC